MLARVFYSVARVFATATCLSFRPSVTSRYCVKTKLLLVANRKVHMRFRLTTRSMTLVDLELYKFEFSENFSGFRRFRTQQRLKE